MKFPFLRKTDPGSIWKLHSNTSSWYFSKLLDYIWSSKSRLGGAPASATQSLGGSAWPPASFFSSNSTTFCFTSTGWLAADRLWLCSTLMFQHQELLLQRRRVQLRLRTSQGRCWQFSGLRLFEEREMVRRSFIWCSLIKYFLSNIGGRGDLPEHHLGEVEVRLRLPVLARKMFHYEWKG